MSDSQKTLILPEELRHSGSSLGTTLRDRYRLDSELGLLDRYQKLVAECQSPRFRTEAQRLATAMSDML